MINVEQTIISQYGTSPVISQLVRNIDQYIDPRADLDTFYSYVWDISTAQGFGLDIWGRIVGIDRAINIPAGTPDPGGKYNYALYSEQFDNAAWIKLNSSVVPNTIVGPDGQLTGDKFVESAGGSLSHRLSQLFTANLFSYSYSVFAKAAERYKLEIIAADGGASAALFDLTAGTVGAPQSAGVTNVSGTATITNVGGGWYRCGISRTPTASGANIQFRLSDGTSTTYSGDGVSGLYISGAQVSYSPLIEYVQTISSPASYVPGVYTMTDAQYRTVLLVKALANITDGTARSINQLLSNLFASRGRCYVLDSGAMTMRYTFEFWLEPFEYVIINNGLVAPRPAGVLATVLQVEPQQTFGFAEGVQFQPFDNGTFYVS